MIITPICKKPRKHVKKHVLEKKKLKMIKQFAKN